MTKENSPPKQPKKQLLAVFLVCLCVCVWCFEVFFDLFFLDFPSFLFLSPLSFIFFGVYYCCCCRRCLLSLCTTQNNTHTSVLSGRVFFDRGTQREKWSSGGFAGYLAPLGGKMKKKSCYCLLFCSYSY